MLEIERGFRGRAAEPSLQPLVHVLALPFGAYGSLSHTGLLNPSLRHDVS